MNPYVRSLEKLAGKYRSAEAEVVRAFFRKPRAKSDHVNWLKAQAYKEYSAIKPLLGALTRLLPHLDKGVDRHQYEELGEKLAEEMKHARLIMDLLEEIIGRKITPKDLPWLLEDKRLARIRARYSRTYAGLLHGSEAITSRGILRKDEDIERAALTLTEGGGGALYQVCSRLKGTVIERKIASVFQEIYLDEVRHRNAGARELAKYLRTRKEFKRAEEIVQRVLGQRLRMRNEQFGFPLSDRRIQDMQRSFATRRA